MHFKPAKPGWDDARAGASIRIQEGQGKAMNPLEDTYEDCEIVWIHRGAHFKGRVPLRTRSKTPVTFPRLIDTE